MSNVFPASRSHYSMLWATVLAILIDLPTLIILLLWGGNNTALLMLLPFSGISLLIVYASYTAGKMAYILGDSDLVVKFPLSPIRVSYTRIKNAGKVDTTLKLRIFGGSIPGAHFGEFVTSNLGKTQVYSTKYKGEFIFLELDNSDKILLSPEDPDAFLESLREKIGISPSLRTSIKEPSLDRRLTVLQLISVTGVWLLFLAYFASVYPSLPDIVPLHFSLSGVPNRYGSKTELIWIAVLATLFPGLNAVFTLGFGKYSKGLTVFLSVVFLLVLGLIWYVLFFTVQAT